MSRRRNGYWSLALALLAIWVMAIPRLVAANDLPLAAGSPIAGIGFDDRPLMLPVQRNFQMAMLTASGELGRSCGKMEAYGWRLDPGEQQRVNLIFNNTVDRLRAQGFEVEAKSPNSVSRDVTLFTADRQDKHVTFMWSAGEIGLVMVLCETSAPVNLRAPASEALAPGAAPNASADVYTYSPSVPTVRTTRTGKPFYADFSPIGDWAGTYTCMQGTMGATLSVQKLKGERFEGDFRFYPTPKNPYVPSGQYKVSGEFDSDSNRILINPGKWVKRPPGYDNTIMIGSFDPVAQTFSGFFQGISGCTSFEARATRETITRHKNEAQKKAAKTSAKSKKSVKASKHKKKASTAVSKSKGADLIDATHVPAVPEVSGIKVEEVHKAEPAPAATSPATPEPLPSAPTPPVAPPPPASATPAAAAPTPVPPAISPPSMTAPGEATSAADPMADPLAAPIPLPAPTAAPSVPAPAVTAPVPLIPQAKDTGSAAFPPGSETPRTDSVIKE